MLRAVSQALMSLGSRSQCVTQTQQQQHNAAQLLANYWKEIH